MAHVTEMDCLTVWSLEAHDQGAGMLAVSQGCDGVCSVLPSTFYVCVPCLHVLAFGGLPTTFGVAFPCAISPCLHPHVVSSLHGVCAQISPFPKDTCHMGSWTHPASSQLLVPVMTLFPNQVTL